jgi:hypothetical protein
MIQNLTDYLPLHHDCDHFDEAAAVGARGCGINATSFSINSKGEKMRA